MSRETGSVQHEEEKVDDPYLAEKMAYAEKPYREKKRFFGLMGASEKDIKKGEQESESIQWYTAESKLQAVEFKQRAAELEGKVGDVSITASNMLCDEMSYRFNRMDNVSESFSAQFSIGNDRIEITFLGNYGLKSSDKKIIINGNSFVVAINGSQPNVYANGKELARKLCPLLKTKAEEFVRGISDKDMQQAKIDARLRKQEKDKRLILEKQKVEEIIKAIE